MQPTTGAAQTQAYAGRSEVAASGQASAGGAGPAGPSSGSTQAPSITLPKGGGAIRGMGEKFSSNPVTGSAGMTVPIYASPGRSGFGPQLAIAYDSAGGNGPFGPGWTLDLPSITRQTDKGIPRYRDVDKHEPNAESDVFILSGAEDLVPVLDRDAVGNWAGRETTRTLDHVRYRVRAYRPRIEGAFARLERWTNLADEADTFWRSITSDNTTTWYGRDADSRVFDPKDPTRVFSWLICQSHNDKGQVIVYRYAREDSTGVDPSRSRAHERNRDDESRSAGRYLKRILYGNRTTYYPVLPPDAPATPLPNQWLFEVVFDYGDHDANAPTPADVGAWDCRNDPFSSHRAGFEVRTYRLCQRVLMFHRFPELGAQPLLVRSTDFQYSYEADPTSSQNPFFSFLVGAWQTGYAPDGNGGYRARALPPIEFGYSRATIDLEVRTLDRESAENIPAGFDGDDYQWVDLDGEGLAGILASLPGGWIYKRNVSPLATANRTSNGAGNGSGAGNGHAARSVARFAPAEPVALMPGAAQRKGSTQTLVDLAGDGRLDLADLSPPRAGFYERDEQGRGWGPFVALESQPLVDFADPNLKLIDLTGDGHADILVTENEAFCWYPSLGEQGFGPPERVPKALDEEDGPRLVFADASQTIFLADMSGDGMVDLVRIRNGEVCYWPNLGYGRFGRRILMDNAPRFDIDELFDPRRVILADIDGSGVTDIVYLGADGARLYFNQSGNAWNAPTVLFGVPGSDNAKHVAAVDLLGNGTTCLVWSSPLPSDATRPLRYVDLMGGQKPHLLTSYVNNSGLEVTVEYRPSTYFYLADKLAGRPWPTRVPFPVHCVSRSTMTDRVRQVVFVTTTSYHHGHFDSVEREYQGFGRVDQLDTETYSNFKRTGAANVVDEPLHQPPVLTRTWYHTGAFVETRDRLIHQFREEYYQNTQLAEHDPGEPPLPPGLGDEAYREAMRALKGVSVRREVYSADARDPAAGLPYSASQSTYLVRLVQPHGPNRHASFLVSPSESITYQYERRPADPRVSHSLVLETNELGMVLKAAAVQYPRRAPDLALPAEVRAEQAKRYVVYTETDYTNDVTAPDTHRLRAGCESRSYELTALPQSADAFFIPADLLAAAAGAAEIPYEQVAAGNATQKRLMSRGQSLFLKDDLSGPLPLGVLPPLGIGHQSYSLAFTDGLVAAQYGVNVTAAEFAAAGYVRRGAGEGWWLPSGTSVYANDARDHFYFPVGARDPLGTVTKITRDGHDLLMESVTDALLNTTSAENDYRVLAARLVTDPNRNRSAVGFDELGVVVRSAVMGKAGANEGDTLADPTSRVEYDPFAWRDRRDPNFVHAFARERHGAANPRWQETYVYFDGGGSAAMKKVQAEPGPAKRWDEATQTVVEVDTTPAVRWVGNGRAVLNNKGNVVKQYEPYFSTTPAYESAPELVETGATAVLLYDPLGRNVRTDYPNGTFAKVEFDPWRSRSYDVNDTVRDSRWYADRGSPDPAGPEPAASEPRAAWLAAAHYDTPAESHTDSLGRTVASVSDYGAGRKAAVRSEADLDGRYSRAFDQEGRAVGAGCANLLGAPVSASTAQKGRRWTFLGTLGAMIKTWDEHGRRFRAEYDVLHRPVSLFVQESAGPEVVFNYLVYGDSHPQAAELNLVGTLHQTFDQAGMMRLAELDFKGSPKRVERTLGKDYKNLIDWNALRGQPDYASVQAAAAAALDTASVIAATSEYDALNRPTRATLPDHSVVVPTYNERNSLMSLDVQVRGQGAPVRFLKSQTYDAKGQRQFARLGNDVRTRYFYDPQTFRLTQLLTHVDGQDPATEPLQKLRYTYDPAGNVTRVRDEAQQAHFFNNAIVEPEANYAYDALYQLVRATGREHAGLLNDDVGTGSDVGFVPNLPHPNDAAAVRTYEEQYEYDLMGNIKALRHRYRTPAGAGGGWTRHYRYAHEDDAANRTNQLAAVSMPGDPDAGPLSGTFDHDAYGNMTRMPHLTQVKWDFMDRMRTVDLGGGGTAYYVYDTAGRRVRKVIERPDGSRVERIYLGVVEVHRERRQNNPPHLERLTLHVWDSAGRIAQVDTKTRDDDGVDPANPLGVPLIRYQHTNHLGSASIETDAGGVVISYEEYHPYGTSAYRSAKPGADISLKRYRFSGKERDDETGLYYSGARYYAAWLARWTSADPGGFRDGLNHYAYCRNNPCVLCDPNGLESTRTYQLGEQFHNDIHTHTDEARGRLEGALRGRIVEDKGVRYRIDRPSLEWRGGRIGWYFNTRQSDITRLGDAASPSDDATPPAAPPGDPPAQSPPPADPPAAPPAESKGGSPAARSESAPGSGGSGGGSGSGNGGSHERSFFTSSFFRGLLVGLAVTVAVVAIVATGGAALAAIAPAASAAIASSGVGTALAVVGTGLTVANTVQSVRQRDLWNNPISEEQANYNLGVGIGSFAGGSLARPISGAVAPVGQRLGLGAAQAFEGGPGLFALPGGGTFGGAVAAPATAGIAVPSAVGVGGTAMGTNVLMMSGRGGDGDGDDNFSKMGRPGRNRPGNNQAQNEQVRSLATKYNLSRDQQRQLHDFIQGADLGYADLENIIRQLFPGNIPGG